MQGREEIEAAMTLLLDAPCRPAVDRDADLLEEAELWEAIGRLVDARRIAVAGEVEWRSREQIKDASLAARQGERNAAELLARHLRVGMREAQRRAALGVRLRARLSLQGEEVPARYPRVAAALQSGAIGVDAARVIVEALGAVRRRAVPEELDAAEEALVESAESTSPDLLRVQASVWQARLDPDGAKPAEDAAKRGRSFRIGREGEDGLTRSVIVSPPEETALLRAAVNAHRRGVQWVRQPSDDGEEDLEWHEAAGDQRSKAQFDFDAVMAVLRAGMRADQDGTGTTAASPQEIVVHVTAQELADQRGCGWIKGALGRISIPSVQRLRCAGSTRLLVIGDHGEPLHLGQRVRLFTRAQRRALAARDGGCAWPGCRAPVAWTEAHHIAWFERDAGATDIENGVLLCSHHHHVIHASDEWEIRIHEHAPHLVPKRWRGAPLRRHRMQQHRMRAVHGAAPPG